MMKYTLLGLGLLAGHLGYAQQTEVSVHLTSGLSAFRGASSESTSAFILNSQNASQSYTNNPNGRLPGLCYGIAGQVQRITPKHTVFGVQAGYEVLQSRVRIANVFDRGDAGISVRGHTTLANQFGNFHAFVGHRFIVGPVDLDLTAGPELGWMRRSHEKGQATTTQGTATTYTTNLDRYTIGTDLRARVNLTAYYKRAGFSLGYSGGLSNYRRGYVGGGTNDLSSQVFRLGLAYRIYGL